MSPKSGEFIIIFFPNLGDLIMKKNLTILYIDGFIKII